MSSKIFKAKNSFRSAEFPFVITKAEIVRDFGYHSHEFCELVLITEGKVCHVINGSESTAETGDVFVFQGKAGHGFRNPEKLEFWNVMFKPEKIFPERGDYRELPGFQALFVLQPKMSCRSGFRSRLKLAPEEFRTAVSILERINSEMTSKGAGYRSAVQSLFLQLAIILSRSYSMGRRDDHAPEYYKLAETVAFIEGNFQKPLRLSALSRMSAMSLRHFHRMFKRYYRMTPADYIIRLRTRHAADLLKNRNIRIFEIASACGFHDSNYFSRIFRKHYGRSPLRFRTGEVISKLP